MLRSFFSEPAIERCGHSRITKFKTAYLPHRSVLEAALISGEALWPELMERLDAAAKHGTLIVTRDRPDRRRKVHLPWKQDYFRHRVAEIREVAGIDFDVKFMGLRHGGNTESGNADLTDAQIRALSAHKTSAMTALYTKATMRQRRAGARKRLEERTKGGNLSK